jgi:hypothetical protein
MISTISLPSVDADAMSLGTSSVDCDVLGHETGDVTSQSAEMNVTE